MPAKDLGNKHVCFKCSTKFYDMKKPDPLCPKCGTDQRESPALKAPAEGGRRGRLSSTPKIIEPAEPEAEEASEDEEVGEFEEEDAEAPAEEDEEI
jgi:uncharacterized protein (TIGR02300 family)